MVDEREFQQRSRAGNWWLWLLIAIFLLIPEIALVLYLALGAVTALRFWWLFERGLNELRRRYPR